MRKILILAANPKDVTRRRLDEEVRDIREGLERAKKRDEFEIIQQWAVRSRDLRRAMLDESPQIVHFTGHSDGEDGLCFEDKVGKAQLVTGEALANLFKLFAQKCQLECVVLNGCYSQVQVEAIAEHIPYVIGMAQAVNEQAAIEFAVGFYDALGRGESVEFAFDFGKAAMELDSTGDLEAPVLLSGPALIKAEFDNEQTLISPRSGLKPGAPFPRVRLPENYVERPDALNAVKDLLLAEDERTLVVSAIAGLGGLGKSVLATALVLDEEVQSRFTDGILWVTLGQKPDLLTMLGNWIRELDKSRESFSANTVETASQYLANLLAERQMLLVVDDVWNAAHAEWFRVGGPECRVLVTTREAQLDGAEYYPLDLMSRDNAQQLVQQKLKDKWKDSQEKDFQAFAKSLGYLPLALELAANHVRDGLSWVELQTEFETERRAIALELLETSECLDDLNEQQQRKYSLQACFNLSLKRLKPEQLQQFAWFGVLPEDVNLTVQIAKVLWGVSQFKAKKTLIDFRKRSLLTDSSSNLEGESTYRVHDLMHDMARNLIEQGNLAHAVAEKFGPSQNRKQNLVLAHRKFLERYRDICVNNCWYTLPKDGYIHRHLTWHLEQGDWTDEIHTLITMSDAKGRNAWFEACDRIGQPAIFVEDVARGWRLAEESYQQERSRAIVLQCRYALITTTLNSLIGNLPIGVMAEFVKQGFWSVEQAWAYVEQIQDEEKIVEVIQTFSSYLSKSLFQIAVNQTRGIQNKYYRAKVLSTLAQLDGTYFDEALSTAQAIRDEFKRAKVLSTLAQLDGTYFDEALSAAQAIQNESRQVEALNTLAKHDNINFDKLLAAAQAIQDESKQVEVLCKLAQRNDTNFDKLLAAAQAIQGFHNQAKVMSILAKFDRAYFDEALTAIRWIRGDESEQAIVLCELAKVDGADFDKLLLAAREMWRESEQAIVLCELAKIDGADSDKLLVAAREIRGKAPRVKVLSALAQRDEAYLDEALTTTCEISLESEQAIALCELTKLDGADFDKLLTAACQINDKSDRAVVLCELTKLDGADFDKLLTAACQIDDKSDQAVVLCELTKVNRADLDKLLTAIRMIQDDWSRISVVRNVVQCNEAYIDHALTMACEIDDEYSRAWALFELAQHNDVDLDKLSTAAQRIRDKSSRAFALSALTQCDEAYLNEALTTILAIRNESDSRLSNVKVDFDKLLLATREIQDESQRASVLGKLVHQNGNANFDKLLLAAREIQNESQRASVLVDLAKCDGTYLDEALAAVKAIQDDYSRAWALIDLAQCDGVYLDEALTAARAIQEKFWRAIVLSELPKYNVAYLDEALTAAQAIQSETGRLPILGKLTKINGTDFNKLLAAAWAIQDESQRAKILGTLAQHNEADFNKLLTAAQAIQNEAKQAFILCKLTKVNEADFNKLLAAAWAIQEEYERAKILSALAQHDGADFNKLLTAAQGIQHEFYRASILCKLTKANGADFNKLLATTWTIKKEYERAKILSALAQHDGADFNKLLAAVQGIQEESCQAEILSELAKQMSQELLVNLRTAITEITHKPTAADALSNALVYFPLSTLPHTDWQSFLHLLACRKRSVLMQDLVTLYPAIIHLGGEEAMRGIVDAMREVCNQWK